MSTEALQYTGALASGIGCGVAAWAMFWDHFNRLELELVNECDQFIKVQGEECALYYTQVVDSYPLRIRLIELFTGQFADDLKKVLLNLVSDDGYIVDKHNRKRCPFEIVIKSVSYGKLDGQIILDRHLKKPIQEAIDNIPLTPKKYTLFRLVGTKKASIEVWPGNTNMIELAEKSVKEVGPRPKIGCLNNILRFTYDIRTGDPTKDKIDQKVVIKEDCHAKLPVSPAELGTVYLSPLPRQGEDVILASGLIHDAFSSIRNSNVANWASVAIIGSTTFVVTSILCHGFVAIDRIWKE